MGYANEAGLSAYNFYGARDTGAGTAGHRHSKTGERELVVEVTPEVVKGGFQQAVNIPANSVIDQVVYKGKTAFAVSTSGYIVFGRDIDNGIKLTEAQLEAAAALTDVTSTAKLGECASGGIKTAMPCKFFLSDSGTITTGKGELLIKYTVLG